MWLYRDWVVPPSTRTSRSMSSRSSNSPATYCRTQPRTADRHRFQPLQREHQRRGLDRRRMVFRNAVDRTSTMAETGSASRPVAPSATITNSSALGQGILLALRVLPGGRCFLPWTATISCTRRCEAQHARADKKLKELTDEASRRSKATEGKGRVGSVQRRPRREPSRRRRRRGFGQAGSQESTAAEARC